MNREEFFANLEAKGEEAVRLMLASGAYGSDKIKLVSEWLDRKKRERDAVQVERNDAAYAAQAALASRAAEAAERAALAAEAQAAEAARANRLALQANATADTANKIAIAAMVVAAIGAIIAIWTFLADH